MLATEQHRLAELRRQLASATHAEATVRAYRSDWTHFESFCRANGMTSLPADPEDVAIYCTAALVDERLRIPTVERRLAAIADMHRRCGHASPIDRDGPVRLLLRGARRRRPETPGQRLPLRIEHLERIFAAVPDEPRLVRDRALILAGFATALRSSSLRMAELEDLRYAEDGCLLYVRYEKQDQERKGRYIAIARGQRMATCPVRALGQWLALRGNDAGPLFTRIHPGGRIEIARMSPQSVWRLMRRAVRRAGLDARRYGTHSMRAGCITAAIEAGCGEIALARHTGHKSLETLRRYYRSNDPFRVCVSGLIGL
jgi:integrase